MSKPVSSNKLAHLAGTGTDANRIRTATGANITLAQYECADLEYSLGSSTKWHAWKL